MSEREPEESRPADERPGRRSIIERLRRHRQSWGDRSFDDSAEVVRRMRDGRIVGGDSGSSDGGCGGFSDGGCVGK